MMFIAQLKTAAVITAACVVVAGGGAVVAKEMLTPPATPVSAQAEPKGLPPTPATNAAATIAWGAVTNELQAGLVPLGGVKGWKRFLFLCPNHSEGTKPQPPHPSITARKRFCMVCGAPKPWSATFVEGESMRMEMHFRNLAKEKRSLFDAGYGVRWRFMFSPVGGGKPWHASYANREDSREASTIPVDVGELNEAAVELALEPGPSTWSFLDPQGRESVTNCLPPGKYTMTATYAHPEHEQAKTCTYWHGTVTTGPVEIEILPAVRVSHKLTGEGRNTRLSVTVTNPGTTPLELNKNVSTDAIRALRFFDADGKRVPTIPPPFPTEGTITVAPGESREFDYDLNIFSPPLKAGHYSIHVSFISADPIPWIIPEQ